MRVHFCLAIRLGVTASWLLTMIYHKNQKMKPISFIVLSRCLFGYVLTPNGMDGIGVQYTIMDRSLTLAVIVFNMRS